MTRNIPLLSSIEFSGYKSFDSNQIQKISFSNNMNIVIGRNNSGKSSILDIVESLAERIPEVNKLYLNFELDENHIEKGFFKNGTSSYVNGNLFKYGSKYIGKRIKLEASKNKYLLLNDQKEISLYSPIYTNSKLSMWNDVASSYNGYLNNLSVRRLNADRDIVPEKETDNEEVSFNGDGATNLIRKFINYSEYNEQIVERTILEELNEIMDKDAHFSGIRVMQNDSDDGYKWEVYLEENDDRYALSKCGSGLKTILLILLNLYLIPKTNQYKDKEIIYAFEEIENNLHPALQRRVFDYLYKYSVEEDKILFITTHSQIAINTFYGKDKAGIYHVVKEDGISRLYSVSNKIENLHVLDDIDARASDLFQSNGIIWVEGPSDRIYILKWLNVLTDFDYVEGRDFQFLYYGGRILSHYTTDDDEEELINILTTNRHSIIVIDSDKRSRNGRLNETKIRIRDEFKKLGYVCWITAGKEIENYLPAEVVNAVHDSKLKQIDKYEVFADYISKKDKNFANHKVDSARKYSQYITKENSEGILDLKKQIDLIKREIEKWN